MRRLLAVLRRVSTPKLLLTRMNVVGRALTRSTSVRGLVRLSVPQATTLKSLTRFPTSSSTSSALNNLFETLKSSGDSRSIHEAFSALISTSGNAASPQPASPVDTEMFAVILSQLIVSGQPNDWKCVEEILGKAYLTLGLQISSDVYSAVLRRLANGGHFNMAQDLLLKMQQLPGNFTPDLTQVHQILEACIDKVDMKFLEELPVSIHKLGLQPTADTFRLLFQAHWQLSMREKGVPTLDEISSLINSYRPHGLTFEPAIVQALFQNYADAGHFQEAEDIATRYEDILKTSEWKTISQEDQNVEEDFQFNDGPSNLDSAARSRLRNAKSYVELKKIEGTLGIQCTLTHYTIVMNNVCRAHKRDEALLVYEKLKEAGISPDAVFVAPLIRILGTEASDASVDKVLDIYRQLVGSNTPLSADGGPDFGTYKSVLRTLQFSRNPTKYLPAVDSILEDMRDRELPMNSSIVAQISIVSEMRRKGNFSDAIEVYREQRKNLDERGYFEILREYCRISFAGDLEVPLITQFFSIVNDMRLQRIPVTPPVYGVILRHIGYIATQLRDLGRDDPRNDAIYQRLVSTVRRVHDFLTLDASISPDSYLLNQLMDAYQRLDCFGDAYRLWDMMYLTNKFDQISITIILDACGYAGQSAKAATILRKLARKGHQLDLRNWNTWVECLCRSGRFWDALDVICIEMPKKKVQPDIQSIEILAKFAKRDNISGEYLRQIEQTVPSLWKKLPNAMRES